MDLSMYSVSELHGEEEREKKPKSIYYLASLLHIDLNIKHHVVRLLAKPPPAIPYI